MSFISTFGGTLCVRKLVRVLLAPAVQDDRLDGRQAEGSADDAGHLRVGVDERGGQGRHVDGVADGLVARRVDDIAQSLLGVLDRAPLRVARAQKYHFLQV